VASCRLDIRHWCAADRTEEHTSELVNARNDGKSDLKSDGWVYEIKTDGYRTQVHIRHQRVTIYSRSGYDWTEQFAPIAKAASRLKVREAIIDGEAAVLGNTGLPDFQALRRELGNRESSRLVLHAFDLLYLNGLTG